MKNITAKISAVIHAPPEKVWNALTSPDMIRQYLDGVKVISQWETGSSITFRGKQNGVPYVEKGIILRAEPYTLFQYTSWNSLSGTEDLPENYMPVIYQLYEENNVTTLTIALENILNEEAKTKATHNWLTVLKNIKRLLEPNPVTVTVA